MTEPFYLQIEFVLATLPEWQTLIVLYGENIPIPRVGEMVSLDADSWIKYEVTSVNYLYQVVDGQSMVFVIVWLGE